MTTTKMLINPPADVQSMRLVEAVAGLLLSVLTTAWDTKQDEDEKADAALMKAVEGGINGLLAALGGEQ